MNSTLLALAILFLFWGIVSMMAMVSYCSKRGIKINWVWIRLYVFKYISQYREITLKENGKPGPWFYSFLVSMNGALILAIVGLILKRNP